MALITLKELSGTASHTSAEYAEQGLPPLLAQKQRQERGTYWRSEMEACRRHFARRKGCCRSFCDKK